jgi:hypothetical protein
MRSFLLLVLATGLSMVIAPLALGDNYLKNADFKEGSQMWRGDGQQAFLKPDGTEGQDGDPGVTPVIRVNLSPGQRRVVYQEFQVHDSPATLHIKLDVYASIDFKRSTRADDYASDDPMPNTDFMVRLVPEYFQQTFDTVKPGEWVTLKADWSSPQATEDRAIYYFIPPGVGVLYIKNPVVTQ